MSDVPDGWAALADISRLGLDTAAAVVERILDLSRSAGEFPMPLLQPTTGADGDPARRLRADAERMIDLYAEWTRGLLDTALSAAAPPAARHDAVHLGPVAAGAGAETTIWLHTLAGAACADARPRSTDLSAHDGAVVPGASVTFSPPSIDASAPGSSHEVRVRVDVPASTAPGRFHGHVLVAGLGDVALPIGLEVIGA